VLTAVAGENLAVVGPFRGLGHQKWRTTWE
jgi:hypothetical protein